ncbi:MAG: iron-sulfur cluster assembly scaffold protein [Novosphingobium sp.]
MAASATALYTPQVLALATRLAGFAPRPDLPLHGAARAAACGSRLELDLGLSGGRICAIGLRAHACAIGQAAAAIFADHAIGQRAVDISAALEKIEAWLAGEGPLPAWPGLEAIAAARDFPGRHGAMLLPWKAACDALSSAAAPG